MTTLHVGRQRAVSRQTTEKTDRKTGRCRVYVAWQQAEDRAGMADNCRDTARRLYTGSREREACLSSFNGWTGGLPVIDEWINTELACNR